MLRAQSRSSSKQLYGIMTYLIQLSLIQIWFSLYSFGYHHVIFSESSKSSQLSSIYGLIVKLKGNSTMKAYLQAFINFEFDDWVRLLLMAEFAHNNAKNTSNGYILFEFYCGYYPCASYKEDINPCSQSKTANKLANQLK